MSAIPASNLATTNPIVGAFRQIYAWVCIQAGVNPSGNVMALQCDASGNLLISGTAPPSGLYRNTAATSTAASVEIGATNLLGYNFINPNSYPVYVKLYDALLANVTVGTTTPKTTIPVPAGGYQLIPSTGGALMSFATGIVIAVTENIADTDATNPAQSVYAEVTY